MLQEHSLAMVFKAKVSEKKTYMITKDIYYSRKYHTGIYVMMCWPIKDNILLTILQKKEKSFKGIDVDALAVYFLTDYIKNKKKNSFTDVFSKTC